jgi:hypothetical protein
LTCGCLSLLSYSATQLDPERALLFKFRKNAQSTGSISGFNCHVALIELKA